MKLALRHLPIQFIVQIQTVTSNFNLVSINTFLVITASVVLKNFFIVTFFSGHVGFDRNGGFLGASL